MKNLLIILTLFLSYSVNAQKIKFDSAQIFITYHSKALLQDDTAKVNVMYPTIFNDPSYKYEIRAKINFKKDIMVLKYTFPNDDVKKEISYYDDIDILDTYNGMYRYKCEYSWDDRVYKSYSKYLLFNKKFEYDQMKDDEYLEFSVIDFYGSIKLTTTTFRFYKK